jgi:hypothetical protein
MLGIEAPSTPFHPTEEISAREWLANPDNILSLAILSQIKIQK